MNFVQEQLNKIQVITTKKGMKTQKKTNFNHKKYPGQKT